MQNTLQVQTLQLFGYISVILALAGFIPYIATIIKGKTKPEKASWWIWSLLMLVAVAVQHAQGATWSLLLTVTFLICNLTVAILSVSRGYGKFRAFDLLAIVLTLFGISLWVYTDNPLTALFITIAVDFMGNWLTVTKTWRAPYSENLFSWLLLTIASIFSLLAVGSATQKAIFPFYEILVNGLSLIVIYQRRRWRANKIKRGLHKA